MFPPPRNAISKQAFVAVFLFAVLGLLQLSGFENIAMSGPDLIGLVVIMEFAIIVYFLIPGLDTVLGNGSPDSSVTARTDWGGPHQVPEKYRG